MANIWCMHRAAVPLSVSSEAAFFQWSRAFKIFCFGFSGRNPTLSHLSQTRANILTLTDEISFWGAKCNILTFQEISSGQYCFSY